MATPPTSYGYPGSVNAAALAFWLPAAAAARFSVAGVEDWRVSVQGGLDRGIRINAGTGCGDGVMDITAEYETMALPLVESGSQWFLVARRRNWSAPATTAPIVIPGSATTALPERSNTPGVESDQPLALCRVQAGQTVVQEIIDLRCWAGNGGMIAASSLAMDYLARPGADVMINGVTWRYQPTRNGSWGWERETLAIEVSNSIVGGSRPAGSPVRTWTGYLAVSSGAGGENRTASPATDANGVGGIWFGYGGVPNFDGIYSVQLSGEAGAIQFAHVPTIAGISLARVKFRARRQASDNWANGYGVIGLCVTVVGW
ncbi:hypothetical protein [Arthrobacter sp. lap29]|uniref:hypothetical protein n=1 Tax=Arthrobacter sp. lap29 TaxID=3056122 RepID=UPI0028F70157|nr:hypothetical protein [Arthrobacter sp. lap29]